MPNWCINRLVITGDKKGIRKIAKLFKSEKDENSLTDMGTNIDFEKILKTPNNCNIASIVQWQIDNWGCKWEPDSSSWEREGNTIIADMDTPWSPPIKIFKYLVSSLHKKGINVKVKISAFDSSMDTAQSITIHPCSEINEEYSFSAIADKTVICCDSDLVDIIIDHEDW